MKILEPMTDADVLPFVLSVFAVISAGLLALVILAKVM